MSRRRCARKRTSRKTLQLQTALSLYCYRSIMKLHHIHRLCLHWTRANRIDVRTDTSRSRLLRCLGTVGRKQNTVCVLFHGRCTSVDVAIHAELSSCDYRWRSRSVTATDMGRNEGRSPSHHGVELAHPQGSTVVAAMSNCERR